MQQLSFTIPYTSSAIRATVTALNQMDNDLNGTVGLFAQAVSNASASIPEYVTVTTDIPTPPHVTSHIPTPPSAQAEQDDEDDELDDVQPEGAVDSAGMLWDARIHSSSKAFLKSDGTWKLKKGVDKSLVAEVLGNAQAPQESTPTPPSATQNNVSTPPPPAAPITETPAPVGNGFRLLLSDITKAGLAPEYVQNMCLEVNGRSLPLCKDDMSALDLLRMSLGL